jgi:hypothetical protein
MANDLSVSTRPLLYFEIYLREQLFRTVEEVALIEHRSMKRVLEDALDQYCDLELQGVTISRFSINNQLSLLQKVGLFIKRRSRFQKSKQGVTVTVGLSEYLVTSWQRVVVNKNSDESTIWKLALQRYTELY